MQGTLEVLAFASKMEDGFIVTSMDERTDGRET
jgi:hypothetical protein